MVYLRTRAAMHEWLCRDSTGQVLRYMIATVLLLMYSIMSTVAIVVNTPRSLAV